ncbi:MAG TPA: hypothetical protein VG148_02070 [Pyrinomonadaceae bacterium]|nr:hypothetical protein [Pyrinomonadaceae bacterium]
MWERFEAEARKRRRDPVNLLVQLMREWLEVREAQELDEQIKADVRGSGFAEDDAVGIVRRYRQAKRPHGSA